MKRKAEKLHSMEVPFYRSISLRLIICFLVPVIGILILGSVSYNSASKAIISSYKKSISQTVDMQQKYIELAVSSEIDEFKNYFTDSSLKMFFGGNMDAIEASRLKRKYNSRMASKLALDAKAGGIYFVADGGRSIQGGKASLPSDAYSAYLETRQGKEVNEKSNDWFLFGQDAEADQTLGITAGSYSIRIARKFQGQDVCIIVDIDVEFIRNVLQSIDTGKGGCVAFITGDGKEFYADSEMDGDSALIYGTEAYDVFIKSEEASGNRITRLNGSEILLVYGKMETGNACVAAVIPSKRLLDETASIKIISFILTAAFAILAFILGLIISGKMSGTIKYVLRKLRKVADGDLTVYLESKSRDEFGALCKGVNQTVSQMKSILEEVKSVSMELDDTTSYVAKAADVFMETSDEIKGIVTEIETGARRLDQGSADCLGNMEQLSGIITNVSINTQEIKRLAAETDGTISSGIRMVNVLGENTETTTSITRNVISSIQELEKKSRSIDTIISAINSISEQTSLLSINASIEAARAGEAGKGFVVVAEEIRKLSDQCLESVNQISEIVNEIIKKTGDVFLAAKETEQAVSSQSGIVLGTTQSFRQIGDRIDNLSGALEVIADNVHDMDISRNKTLETIEDISAVSEETSSCSDHVSAAVVKQLNAIKDLDSSAGQLRIKADSLIELLGSFQL